jgi:5'-deoxynucleotidase YfbR-like HD superfamily hydrolase
VAQHSVLVLEIFAAHVPAADVKARLYALLHDAPEYVMGDIISPFKAAMGGNYKEVENRLLGAIHLHFGLNASAPANVQKAVKRADKEAAYHEAVHLAGFEVGEARKFFGEPTLAAFDLERFDELIRPWPTREAHDRFVDAVDMLATAIHSSS